MVELDADTRISTRVSKETGLVPGYSIGVWAKRTKGFKELLNLALTDTYAAFASFSFHRQDIKRIEAQMLVLESMISPYLSEEYEAKRNKFLVQIHSIKYLDKKDTFRAFLLLRKWFTLMLDVMYKRNLLTMDHEEARV